MCCCICVLQEFHLAREWFYKLPDADVFEDCVSVAVPTARTPRIPVISTDPDVGAAVGILLSVPYCSAVHVSDRYGYGDHLTASTSNPIELSNPNAFGGGKEC
jgi:hypothetical protein